MTWIPALILSLAAGWFLSRRLAAGLFRNAQPLAGIAGELGLGVLFGPGLASILYFAVSAAGRGSSAAAYAIATALAVLSALFWWRSHRGEQDAAPLPHAFPWTWALLLGVGFACLFIAFDVAAATAANPNGEWDGTAIWNVRARFLAGGPATWRRAISAEMGGSMLGASHPGYPLFLSSFVGLIWTTAGSYTAAVPATVSVAVAAALLLLLCGSLAGQRSLAMGLFAALLLAATELFSAQASAQYSDLLLALSFLASLALLDAASGAEPAHLAKTLFAAGLAIGFAAWIKNEGLPFTLLALALAAWRFQTRAVWVAIGSAPGLFATIALKMMAEGREAIFPATVGEAMSKLMDISRWWQALLGFAGAVVQLGPVWAHPVLLLAAMVWVLGLRPSHEIRGRLWLGIPLAGVLIAEYGLLLVTTADLNWHLGTSVTRLVMQVWPSILWLLISLLRTPEEHFVKQQAPRQTPRVRGKKLVH